MRLHNLPTREQCGVTTFGCIWREGELEREGAFTLRNRDGSTVPVQSRVTAYWPDGSVKWSAHTADASLMSETVDLEMGASVAIGSSIAVMMSGEGGFCVSSSRLSLTIPPGGPFLFTDLVVDGATRVNKAFPVLQIERREESGREETRTVCEYEGNITDVTVEEEGPVQVVIKYEGIHHHHARGEELIPFVIRLSITDDGLRFVHTFLYDGVETRDFLKGIGISFLSPLSGAPYNRHIRFLGDAGSFHESSANLLSWRPRIPEAIYASQCAGERLRLQGEARSLVERILPDMPHWDSYAICQDSPTHFSITKKLDLPHVCSLSCLHGAQARGGLSVGGENGWLAFTIRDFSKRHPSGYTVSGLTSAEVRTDLYFYSPVADAFDFRHYTDRGYNQVYYEGYDFFGASAYGIAATSECALTWGEGVIASEHALMSFTNRLDKPPLYVGESAFYHERRAFGPWSLPSHESEMERWLEAELDKAVAFYAKEVEQRHWTGLFDYGDFMHTYDRERHVWRYDMGGYAWDNTELVPTLWLWLAFLRSGREEIFTLAEKMSRHASETDMYHFGPYKGLGSRHNVRHWGCPCKEARIAMAAHHRYFYYLTGDRRMEDIFSELKDNELTFLVKDPLGEFYDKEKMVYPSHARSGPDWSSLCSNWMTEWERFNDDAYREKIMIGIRDIEAAPLSLVSGPDFEFDPESVHLRYIGEKTTGGTHLQICMGAPSIWMEMADLLDYEQWKRMMADYGRFYFLPRQQQLEESGGLIGDREFSLPFMASAMGAYGAWYLDDRETADRVWATLLGSLLTGDDESGFAVKQVEDAGNRAVLEEIPWISTNFAAQWCLNVIICLAFIPDALPPTLEEARRLLSDHGQGGFRNA